MIKSLLRFRISTLTGKSINEIQEEMLSGKLSLQDLQRLAVCLIMQANGKPPSTSKTAGVSDVSNETPEDVGVDNPCACAVRLGFLFELRVTLHATCSRYTCCVRTSST